MDKEFIKATLNNCKGMRKCMGELDFPHLTPSGQPLFNDLIKSIIYQQLSGKAAETIYNRFLNLFESGNPSPPSLLELSVSDLREVGISRQKAGYLHSIAEAFLSNDFVNQDWESFTDEELLKKLTTIKGVGSWTAKMILMFNLGRPDVFPFEDLGIQLAMKDVYELNQVGKELTTTMRELAKNWIPYRSYASLYLWSWKDKPSG